jgi:hypothetical protein
MDKKFILYFDDTGSRDPDKNNSPIPRNDHMDCFGLGGILVKKEDVDEILLKHTAFCKEWRIDYPLHSSRIRGGQGKFGWLKKPENAGEFLPALQDFLLSLPFVGIACIVDRQGYVDRYKGQYNDQLWFLCKTAFSILIERSAKFADDHGRKLEIIFEEAGKKEDRNIVHYLRTLKREGNPFRQQMSENYTPLNADDYKRIILGEPRRKTKNVPLLQIADLVLYPIAKGGYDPNYKPYKKLKDAGKLIDCHFSSGQIPFRGIKYSCFNVVRDEKK